MSHITASKICSTAEKQTIEKQVDTMNETDIAKTEKVLRTAYFLANEDRPFSLSIKPVVSVQVWKLFEYLNTICYK